jgi:hypothetical protein
LLALVELSQLRLGLLASLDDAFVLLLDLFSEPAALLLDFVVGLGLLLLLAFDFLAGLEFYPPDLLDLRVVYDFELFLVLSDL